MSRPVDCVNKIEIAPAALPLAPAATELEFRGPLLQSGWSVSLKEEIVASFPLFRRRTAAERIFPFALEQARRKKHCYSAPSRVLKLRPRKSKKREKRR
jgi:hypothetical protein